MIDIVSPSDYLTEWLIRFVKNKDLIFRKIESIGKSGELVIAKLKDGKEHAYLVEPFLGDIDAALAKLKGYEISTMAVYNTKENFDSFMKSWDKFARFSRQFSIHFINPFSKTEKRWTLFPMTHDMVTEKAGLKPGLLALFANVEATTKEEVEKVIKSDS